MAKLISFEKYKEGCFTVRYVNGVYLGDILMKEDGFYDFWPEYPSKGGCWSSHVLRGIADELDALNAPWEKQINDYFDSQESGPDVGDGPEFVGWDARNPTSLD